jgi:hypothetical protein
MPRLACVSAWMLLTASGLLSVTALADESKPPLHERIDRLIEQGTVGPVARMRFAHFWRISPRISR